MNCNKYKSLLHLYKKDELSKIEHFILNRHLKFCPDCVKELQEISDTINSFTNSIKSSNCNTPIDEMISDKIIANLPNRQNYSVIDIVITNIQNTFLQPGLKFIIIFFVMLFLGQQYYMLNKITKLENQLAEVSNNTYINSNQDIYTLSNAKITQIEKFLKYSLLHKTSISKNEFIAFTRKYINHQLNEKSIMHIIKSIPDLEPVYIENGLNTSEIYLLITHCDKIIKTINTQAKGDFHA